MDELVSREDALESLTKMRRCILGARRILKDEGLTEETMQLKALGSVNAAQCLEILDLYLTGHTTRRGKFDISNLGSLISEGARLTVTLSDSIQSRMTILSSKPYVKFETIGQYDEETWMRWQRINKPSSHPTEDMMPTQREIKQMVGV